MRVHWIVIPSVVLSVLFINHFLMVGSWPWYYTLKIPTWAPSSQFIRSMWYFIYVSATASVLIMYDYAEPTRRFFMSIGLYVLSTLFHVYWVCLFFYLHYIGYAVWCAAGLALSLWLLIYSLWPVLRVSAVLLLPYALWTSFATIINASIWLIN